MSGFGSIGSIGFRLKVQHAPGLVTSPACRKSRVSFSQALIAALQVTAVACTRRRVSASRRESARSHCWDFSCFWGCYRPG